MMGVVRGRGAMPDRSDWQGFLAEYHRTHPGITEQLLVRALAPGVGTPYDWLRSAFPADLGRVVDLACGSAPLVPLLGERAQYVGLDIAEAELAIAALRGRGPLARADACRLPLPDDCADAVVCSMAIMLLQPVESALAEVARILRPGGLFVATRPVTWPLRMVDLRVTLPLLLSLRQFPEVPQRFARRGFRRLLREAGLVVTADEALRFAHPLADPTDAASVVDALYLPRVSGPRRAAAIEALARVSAPGVEVPVAIRRTIAIREGA